VKRTDVAELPFYRISMSTNSRTFKIQLAPPLPRFPTTRRGPVFAAGQATGRGATDPELMVGRSHPRLLSVEHPMFSDFSPFAVVPGNAPA